jgi:hypothetical protein
METVMKQQCRPELVNKTVTRYEHQYESRFVPARLETVTRQRLRELEPECYVIPSQGPGAGGHRIEGRIFTDRE